MTEANEKVDEQAERLAGELNPDPDFWRQQVTFQLSLLQVMALHGFLCLARRHPATGESSVRGDLDRMLDVLGDLLLRSGAMTPEMIAYTLRVEDDARAKARNA